MTVWNKLHNIKKCVFFVIDNIIQYRQYNYRSYILQNFGLKQFEKVSRKTMNN